jgi:uncharacterized membrane-anchored protein
MPYVLSPPPAVATLRSPKRILIAAMLAIALLMGYSAASTAQAAELPTITIDVNDTLAQVKAAVAAVGPGASVELIDWSTLTVNNSAVCTWAVVITLYSLSAGVVAYLSTAGVLVTIAGVAITAGQLAAFASGLIKWQDVYKYVDTNVCV